MLKQDHVIFKTADSIQSICNPLFDQFDLNYFRYMRIYADNSRIILSSNPYWTEHFFANKFFELAWFDNKPYDYHTEGPTIWNIKAVKEDNQVGIDSRQQFDMFHGITLVKRHQKFTEFMDFTASANHSSIENVFNSSPFILNRFVLFFKDQAEKIISESERSKIILPIHNRANVKLVNTFDQQKIDFFNKTKIKNYYITNDVKFTARQVRCIELMYHGLSIREIANKLFIAERTVETHIQNAKNSVGCKKREDLIRMLIREGVIDSRGE